jgi:hypothetical protein
MKYEINYSGNPTVKFGVKITNLLNTAGFCFPSSLVLPRMGSVFVITMTFFGFPEKINIIVLYYNVESFNRNLFFLSTNFQKDLIIFKIKIHLKLLNIYKKKHKKRLRKKGVSLKSSGKLYEAYLTWCLSPRSGWRWGPPPGTRESSPPPLCPQCS